MTGTIDSSETLRFHCPSCQAELGVPASLAGVEGPCPSCFQTIRAPVPEALYSLDFPDFPELMDAPEGLPPPREAPRFQAGPVFPGPREEVLLADMEGTAAERNFKARLSIPPPPPDEPLDDSWKGRHRERRRRNRRVRKVEEAAQSFLESRTFRITRVVLILLSAVMLTWLFQYLRTHQWRLPGMSPAVAGDDWPGPGSGLRGTAGAPGDLMTDDDTEIPPASNFIPDKRSSSLPDTSVAGTPAPP